MRAWLDGAYELIVSLELLSELERVLTYPTIARRVSPTERVELLAMLRVQAEFIADPTPAATVRSPDPDDDYLIDLAAVAGAVLVTGDNDLLGLADDIPVYTPAAFRTLLDVR